MRPFSLLVLFAWVLLHSTACGLVLDPTKSTESDITGSGTPSIEDTDNRPDSDEVDADIDSETEEIDERLVIALGFNGNVSDLEPKLSDLEFEAPPLGEEDGREVFFADEDSLIAMDANTENSSLDRFSVELWFKPSTYPNGGQRFALADKDGDWGVFLHSDAHLRFAPSIGERMECEGVELNKWYHVVLVVDRSQQKARSYLNGSRCEEVSIATEPGSRQHAIHVGSNSPDGQERFQGSIDLFHLWDEPLREQEICDLYGNC